MKHIELFSSECTVLISLLESGRSGKLPISVRGDSTGYTVRIGKHIRVRGKTLVECQEKIKAQVARLVP